MNDKRMNEVYEEYLNMPEVPIQYTKEKVVIKEREPDSKLDKFVLGSLNTGLLVLISAIGIAIYVAVFLAVLNLVR